tara:strand:- start:51 stop:773 length:723 start_codon:yes stop_codon:yes gene_type:complete
MCNLSYEDHIDYKQHLLLHDLIDSVTFIENKHTDAQCYIMNSDKTIYICFRGTSSFKDAITDLKTFQKTFIRDGVKVHRGFYKQFSSIEEQITNYIKSIIDYDVKLWKFCFIGHSLGGGLATLASVYYKNKYSYFDIECITFGSPRVGNKKFASLYKEYVHSSYRIVNHKDPIQYVPMSPLYTHVDDSYCIKDDELVLKKEVKKHKRLFNSFKNLNCGNIVKSHSLTTYLGFFSQFFGSC